MNLPKKVLILSIIFVAGTAASFAYHHKESGYSSYEEMHKAHHGDSNMSGKHHQQNHQHDMVRMPGLQGKDTTEQEVQDLKTIFISHKGIQREVANLPNGIKSTTETDDPTLKTAIVTHVTMMVSRLQEGRNPEIIIQSPTLSALFDVHQEIETKIEMTEKGIIVTQTSSNPKVVQLLQTHAAEVSDMSKRGMEAVHERMSQGSH